MGSKECTSKGGVYFEGGLLSEFQIQTSIDKVSCNKEQVFEPGETTVFDKGSLSNDRQKAITSIQKVISLGFYSRLFLVPKTGNFSTSNRSECGKQIFACSNF